MNVGKIEFFSQNTPRHTTKSAFNVDGKTPSDLPRVEIVYPYENLGPEVTDSWLSRA